MPRLVVVASGLLLAAELFSAWPVRAQQFDVPASGRSAILAETNAYRRMKGLTALSESEAASRVAQTYATYLARTKKTGHGADGRSPAERLRAAGIKFCKFRGENWYGSWTSPKRASTQAAVGKAMRFWKGSAGHERALRSASTEVGVGMAGWRHGSQWHYVAVQMFLDTSCVGRPRSPEEPPPLPDRNPARAHVP